MALTYRSIPLDGGYWSSQGYEDTGVLVIGPHIFGIHSDRALGTGGSNVRSAKDTADAACAGYVAEFGGTFDTSNDPFE